MNTLQKAAALETMMQTQGWEILHGYLLKNAIPQLVCIDSLDSVIKQSYRHGVCQGHKDVLDFIKATIEHGKRKQND